MFGLNIIQAHSLILTPDMLTAGWLGSSSLKYTPWRYRHLLSSGIIDSLCVDSYIAASYFHPASQTQLAALYTYDGQHLMTSAGRLVRQPLVLNFPLGLIMLEWTQFQNTTRGLLRKFLFGIPRIPFVLFNALLMLLPQTIGNILYRGNIFGLGIVVIYFGRAMAAYFISIVRSTSYQIGSYTISTQQKADSVYLKSEIIKQVTTLNIQTPHRIVIDSAGFIRRYRPVQQPKPVWRQLWGVSQQQQDPLLDDRISSGRSLMQSAFNSLQTTNHA